MYDAFRGGRGSPVAERFMSGKVYEWDPCLVRAVTLYSHMLRSGEKTVGEGIGCEKKRGKRKVERGRIDQIPRMCTQ